MLIHMIYLKKYKLYETPITSEWSSRQVLNFMDSPINFQAYRMEKSKSQIPNTTLQRTQQVHESPMSGLSKKEALSLDQWVLPALDKTRQDKDSKTFFTSRCPQMSITISKDFIGLSISIQKSQAIL